MSDLFETLTRAVEGAWPIALAAAFAWGILSVLLSPCHLSSIPLIVGFVSGQGRTTTRRAFALSTCFAVGILVTIAAVGVVTAGLGQIVGDAGRWGNYFVALIFFAVGLYLMDILPMPWSGAGQVALKRKGMISALLLGLLFGIAVGPCTFAYMAPMLGVTFQLASSSPTYGIALLGAFGAGHSAVIMAAGTFTEWVQRYLDWNERSRGVIILKRVCGGLLILGGLYLIYSAP